VFFEPRHLAGHAEHGIDHWALAHGDASDIGEFVNDATLTFGRPPRYVVPLGASMGSHTGPGALVVGFTAS